MTILTNFDLFSSKLKKKKKISKKTSLDISCDLSAKQMISILALKNMLQILLGTLMVKIMLIALDNALFMPPPFSVGWGGHIVSRLSVHPSVHMKNGFHSISSVHMKNGFHSISSEKISVLDSYFIQKYIIIKYRSSLIYGKIHQVLWE